MTLALKHGHHVTAVSRRQPSISGVPWIPFDLSTSDAIVLPSEAEAVIHLAANTSGEGNLTLDSEVQAAQALQSASQRIEARFIFLSSQTARQDAPTPYGRTKWCIERTVLSAGGVVVRPGLVYGGPTHGLYGRLVTAIRRLPLLPAFIPPPKVQPIHVDDLACALLRLVEYDIAATGILCLGAAEGISFSEFLAEISRSRLRQKRLFIPIPVVSVRYSSLIIAKASGNRLSLEQLRSLFDLPPMATAADLGVLKVILRPLRSGMNKSGDDKRRRLLREGRAMFVYLLKQPPENDLVRRYVRCVEQLRGGQPLKLSEFVLRYPVWMALFDSKTSTTVDGEELAWRLDAATVLAEATRQGSDLFLGVRRRSGPLASLLTLSGAVFGEVIWRLLALAAYPYMSLRSRGARKSK